MNSQTVHPIPGSLDAAGAWQPGALPGIVFVPQAPPPPLSPEELARYSLTAFLASRQGKGVC